MSDRTEEERKEIRANFRDVVNMAPKELEKWLQTDASKSVGEKRGASQESTGHRSGRRIVRIKRKNVDDLTGSDYDWMKKVIGYVRRHTAQRPDGDIENTNWRYSLMNWGHDPLKE